MTFIQQKKNKKVNFDFWEIRLKFQVYQQSMSVTDFSSYSVIICLRLLMHVDFLLYMYPLVNTFQFDLLSKYGNYTHNTFHKLFLPMNFFNNQLKCHLDPEVKQKLISGEFGVCH